AGGGSEGTFMASVRPGGVAPGCTMPKLASSAPRARKLGAGWRSRIASLGQAEAMAGRMAPFGWVSQPALPWVIEIQVGQDDSVEPPRPSPEVHEIRAFARSPPASVVGPIGACAQGGRGRGE